MSIQRRKRAQKRPRRSRVRHPELLEARQLLTTLSVNTRFDTVDTDPNVTSLREALQQANALPGHDTITFDSSLSFETVLLGIRGFDEDGIAIESDGGELVVRDDVTIDASRAGLVRIGREPGDNNSTAETARLDHRVLSVAAGDVTISNVVVQRGQTAAGEYGAGIHNAGDLTLINSIVADNVQLRDSTTGNYGGGGGIYNAPEASLQVFNSNIGAVEFDAETLMTLDLDPASFAQSNDGRPVLLPGNSAEGPGGGIFNEGSLTIEEQSTVEQNASGWTGGGIFNAGVLMIDGSEINRNSTTADTGCRCDGGGIFSSIWIPRQPNTPSDRAANVAVTIQDSTIAENSGRIAGGIYIRQGSSLQLTDSILRANSATQSGAALYNFGTTEISTSTFLDNQAAFGGAIYAEWGSQTLIDTSTFAQNHASQSGGGILANERSTLVVQNSTLANNHAGNAGGGIFARQVPDRPVAVIDIANSIVADNFTNETPDDINGPIESNGSNLVGTATNETVFADSDLVGLAPRLGPLGEYGGPTPTYALLPDSPAIDSGPRSGDATLHTTDQRGETRWIGPAIDRGAFESQPPQRMLVDSLGDEINGFYGPGDFTLREALAWSAQIPGDDTIGFSSDLIERLRSQPKQNPLELVLSAELTMDSNVTIVGPGAELLTISGDQRHGVLSVPEGISVSLHGLSIADATEASFAIDNLGELNLDNVAVRDNLGGGILNGSSANSNALLTLSQTHVSNNSHSASGAGIRNWGIATIDASTISRNHATLHGGGISNLASGDLQITNSTISTNTADQNGAGLYAEGPTSLHHVTITANLAAASRTNDSTTSGGGIWSAGNENLRFSNSIIHGNLSSQVENDILGNVSVASSFNLVGIGGNLTDGVSGNSVGFTEPILLGPLSSHDERPPTHTLLPGSPAIDIANVDDFPSRDQRGTNRPIGGLPDMGAIEFIAPILPNPIIVDTLAGAADGIYGVGQTSIGDAIAFANASDDHDRIEFASSLFERIDVTPSPGEVVNLARAIPVTASDDANFSFYAQGAIDGSERQSWTYRGTNEPSLLVEFPMDVSVTGVNVLSNRSTPDGSDFLSGRIEILDREGAVLFANDIEFADPALRPIDRDFFQAIPHQVGVRGVRFTGTAYEGTTPGIAELEIYGGGGAVNSGSEALPPETGEPTVLTTGIIGLGGAALVITKDLTIDGPGVDRLLLSGEQQSRVFRIEGTQDGQPNVTISGMSIVKGQSDIKFVNGGFIFPEGGAIQNTANLQLTDVFVGSSLTGGFGGGIANSGSLTLNDVTVAENRGHWGGGIHNLGELTMTNSTVSSNTAQVTAAFAGQSEGGGIFNRGTVNLEFSTVTQNSAERQGGGIHNEKVPRSEAEAIVNLSNSIVAGNHLTFDDTGIDGWSDSPIASGGHNLVGDIHEFRFMPASTDVWGTSGPTTAQNRSPIDPQLTELVSFQGGVPVHGLLPGSPAIDKASVVAAPRFDQRGIRRPQVDAPDIGAYELEPFSWATTLQITELTDTLDGDYRPGNLTLREALLWANYQDGTNVGEGQTFAADTISFSPQLVERIAARPSGTATLELKHGALLINDDVTITDPSLQLAQPKPGAELLTISAGERSRLLVTDSPRPITPPGDDIIGGFQEVFPTVRIAGLTLADGSPQTGEPLQISGGAILNFGDLTLENVIVENSYARVSGAGIYNSGGLSLHRSEVRNNAGSGGIFSVFSGSGSQLQLESSTVANNAGDGIAATSTTVHIHGSTIHTNDGDGLFVSGSTQATLSNSTISSNAAVGITNGSLFEGKAELYNVTIADNRSNGFWFDKGELASGNTLIANNQGLDGRLTGTAKFTTLGYNLFGNTSLPLSYTDIITANHGVGPLNNNSGPTRTHVLSPTSPAIDAGSSKIMPPGTAMRLADQRGRPLINIPDDELSTDGDRGIPDIGAYEVQAVGSNSWEYAAVDQSQFGEGEATVFGFGFDDGNPNSKIDPEPYFLGFEFDTGPQKIGGIESTAVGKFGGELAYDFSGRLGFDVGFYVNSGSVDVSYDGQVNYVIDNYPSGDRARVSSFVETEEGDLYTVSPKVGAYADLVIELDLNADATGCLFGCVHADLLNFSFNKTEELFALNRQLLDDQGRPLFFDLEGNAWAQKNGQFFQPNQNTVISAATVGDVLPVFDGEIRYFSLGLEDIASGLIDTKDLQTRIAALRSGKDLYDAQQNLKKATNRVEQYERELADAKATRDNADRAADVINANRKIEALEGKDGNGGKLKNAQDAKADSKSKVERDASKFKKKAGKAARTIRTPKFGVGVDFGEADGSLLGLQAELNLGVGTNGFSATKNLGTIQVTLPDVNLRDSSTDALGRLSATTDDFAKNSKLDQQRQLAKAQVDLGTLLPFGGRYDVELGPLRLGLTTVSYNLGPQLNVTQDVLAEPAPENLRYDFFAADATPASVWVTIDDAEPTLTHSISFRPGASVVVETKQTDLAGQAITVAPTLTMSSRFSNNIGLDVDVDGVFEAFGMSLEAFGVSIFDVKPLIQHEHTLATFDIPSVFTASFPLESQAIALSPFTLFDQTMDGRTANTALMTTPTDQPHEGSTALILPQAAPPPPPPVRTAAVVENEAFDLETGRKLRTGTIFGPGALDAPYDFQFPGFLFNADQDVSFSEASRIAFLNNVPFESVNFDLAATAPLTSGNSRSFDRNDTFVIQTSEGNLYKIGDIVPFPNATTAWQFKYQKLEPTEQVLGDPVWVMSELLDAENELIYTQLDLQLSGTPVNVDSVQVIDRRITVEPTATGFRLTGFDPSMLSERSSALFAIIFTGGDESTVLTATRSEPVTISKIREISNGNEIDTLSFSQRRRPFEALGASAALSNDLDGDGLALPETDGELLLRYLRDGSDAFSVNGAVGTDATRTTSEAIASYIQRVLDQPILVAAETYSTLDLDGNQATDVRDAMLFQRYLEGKTGTSLTAGIVDSNGLRTTAEDIIHFIEVGRAVVSDVQAAEFEKVVSRTGTEDFVPAPVSPDAIAGSSAAVPLTSSSEISVHTFPLFTYGAPVEFNETYLNDIRPENLISRIADGSPIPFGNEKYRELVNCGTLCPDLTTRTVAGGRLGQDEPIFVEAPDAVGYHYQANNNFKFESLVIDPLSGGNVFQSGTFDLYLLQGNEWTFKTVLSANDPAQRDNNGLLIHTFATPTEQFRLFSRSLPNNELHDDQNESAPSFKLTTGFLLTEGTGSPTVTMNSLGNRELFFSPDAVEAVWPISPEDTSPMAATFVLQRDGSLVVPTVNTVGQSPIQIASATEITVNGHDQVDDTLILDVTAGPIRVPLVFDGGFRTDRLVVEGEGAALDLTHDTSLRNVEIVDIRGAGPNSITLDALAIVENDPVHKTLRVLRNANDQVHREAGWKTEGFTQVDGVEYEHLTWGDATLLLSQVITDAGDLNGDGQLNSADIDFLFAAIREDQIEARLDLNGDEVVDHADVDYLLTQHLGTRRGDANLNGTVGFEDFLLLSASFGQTENATWSNGDFDGDQSVDFADFLLLSANFDREP